MADAIKVAQNRREEYKKDISKKEAEIEELKELISDLDSFIEFGEALVSDDDVPTDAASKTKTETTPDRVQSKPVVSKPVVSKPSPQAAPQPIAMNPADDEWGTDDDAKGGIARVLAARNG
ncbi:MAG: hypothetical protein AAF718_05515 [Pseudomonadota bacterium]